MYISHSWSPGGLEETWLCICEQQRVQIKLSICADWSMNVFVVCSLNSIPDETGYYRGINGIVYL